MTISKLQRQIRAEGKRRHTANADLGEAIFRLVDGESERAWKKGQRLVCARFIVTDFSTVRVEFVEGE